MSDSAVADAVVSLAALVGVLVLFYGPWQSVCTDISRQFIFERRDRLFDMALAGRLSFDSEAYRNARRALNGLLRSAHTLTWQELVIGAYFIKKNRLAMTDWRNSVSTLPADVCKDIEDLVKECTAALIVMMALRSIFISPIVFTLGIVIVCAISNWRHPG